jgi:hypothetical protein
VPWYLIHDDVSVLGVLISMDSIDAGHWPRGLTMDEEHVLALYDIDTWQYLMKKAPMCRKYLPRCSFA